MGLREWLIKALGRDAPPPEDELARPPSPLPEARDPEGSRSDPLDELRAMPPAEGSRKARELLAREADRALALAVLRWLREMATGTVELPASERMALAEFFDARGEWETAAIALRTLAGDLGPSALPARMRLGERAAADGDLDLARVWYERVLAVDLDHPGARERLERLRRPARVGEAGATLLAPEAGVGVGRYELVKELGRGGAGAVFLGRDGRLGRSVAVKLYHPQARADRGARLRGEAHVAAAVASPTVVRVHDLLEQVGAIVMEHAGGGSLRQRIARGTCDEAGARRWLVDLASALALAHQRGWVHRDVKPGNILLRSDGRAALTDFGLARRIGETVPAAEGTSAYVPPEVRGGGRVGPEVDVFAFGAVALELPRVAGWTSIIEGCVSPDPTRRPRDGAELLAEIRARSVTP